MSGKKLATSYFRTQKANRPTPPPTTTVPFLSLFSFFLSLSRGLPLTSGTEPPGSKGWSMQIDCLKEKNYPLFSRAFSLGIQLGEKMEDIFFDFMDFMKKPSVIETLLDILLCAVPIWVAVMIGLVIGWSWRPRWTGLVYLGLRSKFRFLWTAPPGFGARRLWLAFTALSAFSVGRTIWSNFKLKRKGPTAAAASSSPAGTARSVEGNGGDVR